MLFLFSADSDFIFGKNAPRQLLRLNFQNKSDFCNYDFSFQPVGHYQVLFQSSCIETLLRELVEREVTSSTHGFNFSLCEPSLLSMQHEIL